ncbi:MAG TPA: hypothetical protein VJO15_06395, partial [Dehalococcoidia bacterium]|nr:hypothetical protein [Dehalococcoidia bacterium]
RGVDLVAEVSHREALIPFPGTVTYDIVFTNTGTLPANGVLVSSDIQHSTNVAINIAALWPPNFWGCAETIDAANELATTTCTGNVSVLGTLGPGQAFASGMELGLRYGEGGVVNTVRVAYDGLTARTLTQVTIATRTG